MNECVMTFFIQECVMPNILFKQLLSSPGPQLPLPAKWHSQPWGEVERSLLLARKHPEVKILYHVQVLGNLCKCNHFIHSFSFPLIRFKIQQILIVYQLRAKRWRQEHMTLTVGLAGNSHRIKYAFEQMSDIGITVISHTPYKNFIYKKIEGT